MPIYTPRLTASERNHSLIPMMMNIWSQTLKQAGRQKRVLVIETLPTGKICLADPKLVAPTPHDQVAE